MKHLFKNIFAKFRGKNTPTAPETTKSLRYTKLPIKESLQTMIRNIQAVLFVLFVRVRQILLPLEQRSIHWAVRFQQATPQEQWVMIRKPLFVCIIIFLLVTYGSVFTPPTITTSFPGTHSTEAPLDTKIEIIFTKGVIESVAQQAFRISPPVSGTFQWETNQKLIFLPKEKLLRGKTYTVSFQGFVFSTFFVPMFGNGAFSFTTIGNPKVVVASPKEEATQGYTPITIVFDRQMIPLTTAVNKTQKQPAFTISPEIQGEGTWLGTTAYQFRPSQPLKNGTTYTVSVPTLHSQDGGTFNGYRWQFSSQRPHVEAVTPEFNEKYASPVGSIAAFFSQPIDQSSVADKFIILDNNNNPVAGNIIVTNTVVGFYPSSPLQREQHYTAIVKAGIAGSDGPNGMEQDYSWSFAIANAPAIIRTTPVANTKGVIEQNSISVNFKTPMDEDSFKGNITINPAPETDPSLSFSSYNDQHTLSIGTYLGRSKAYSVTVGSNVKDQYGTPLGTAYTFSFQTAPYQPALTIYPANTYFGAFNQQVTQRIVAQVVNTNHIDYTLYKLTKENVLDLYKRHYGDQCRQDSACQNWQSYDTSALAKVNSWGQDFDADKDTPTQVVSKVTLPNGKDLPSGFYFLNLKIPQGSHDNMVMIVSKATVTVKKSNGQIFAWAVNQATGETVGNMHMQLMDNNGTILSEGNTNKDGVFSKDVNLFQKDNLFVVGSSENDAVFAASAWKDGIDIYDFGLPSYYSANEQKDYNTQQSYKTYIVLDRPIYRPGQKVYFKGVIRKDTDGAYENVPEGEKIAVTITDAMNRKVYTQDLPLTSYGSFAGNFVLGKQANLGYYQVGSLYLGNSAIQAFQVEEYKKPDLKVSVSPSKSDYTQGETADITLNASYYFGAPYGDKPISYTIDSQDFTFQWDKNWRFEFGDPDAYWDHPWWYFTGPGYRSQTMITTAQATTNSKGDYVLHLPVDISKHSGSQQMIIEASISDNTNQSFAASQTITIHKSAIYVGVHASSWANQSGKDAAVEIVTVSPKGQEIPKTPVSVTFYKRTWQTVREQNPDDGQFYYTAKPSDTKVSDASVTTDDQGYAKASFTPAEGGTYKAVVSVTDKNGNQNTSGSFIWVSGVGFEAPRQNNDRIVISTDKPEYFVGDTLSVFVATPFASSAAKTLLTAERGSVLSYKIVDSSDTANNFTMPVPASYAPNAYIGAVLVKPGGKVVDPAEFKIGYTPIKVTDKNHQVNVKITTDNKRYKPQGVLHATIETKDGNGKPIATELAVGLVDKAVWDLAQVELPDIYKVFYEPRSLEVSTAQLLTVSIDRINANLNLGAKGGSGGGCFTGDTPILMEGGLYTPIKDIHVGDTILTRKSDSDATLVPTKVLKTFKHVVDRYLIINGTLQVTPIHKIFVNGRWTVAGTIIPGDTLIDKNNTPITVFSVEQVMGKFDVYNLETATYHTYFAKNIYVHNQKGGADTTRNNFPDTAYWNPYVKTDASGKAQVTIPLPDSLTTWRLAAIANSDKAAFGQTTTEILVSRDIVVRPFLPRFLAIGDTAKLGAVIVNTSGQDQTLSAQIKATGITIAGDTTKQIIIPDGGETTVTWDTVAQNTTTATITISAIGSGNKTLDAIAIKLPVKSYSVPEVVATDGQAKDSARETILLPKTIDTTQGEATLSFTPALGGASIQSLSYLFAYPYDCMEQVTSKFMPAVYVHSILQGSKTLTTGTISSEQLSSVITNETQTLTSQQHADGGWGWFTEYGSDPYISAYALSALYAAKNDGFTVSNQTTQRAKDYLVQELGYNKVLNKNVQAYIISVLATNNQSFPSSYASNLFQRRFELSLEARAYLALAMRHMSGMSDNANKLSDEILSLLKLTATTAHWEENDADYHLLGSNTTTTAAMLELLVDQNRNNPLIPKVIRYLMNSRTDGHWNSTRDTAAVIKAITKEIIVNKDETPDEKYQVLFNGKKQHEGAFTKDDLLKVIQYSIPVSKIPLEKKNTITVTKSGTGNLYYNLNLKYFLPFATIDALDQGIVISRQFVDSNGKKIPMDSIEQGSEVWIRLVIVTPAERHFVAIEDVLPAGLESVNESLKNVSVLNKQTPKASPGTTDTTWYFDHKEYHDDRTTIFARDLPAGVYEVSYRVRATTPGKYHYPPAQAYELYTPDVSGHSTGGWLEVK